MTNGEVLNLYETLMRISDNKELTFGVRIGYIMIKNKQLLRTEAQIIHQMRQQIIMEVGKRQDNGDIIVPAEKIDETNMKINELMNLESQVKIESVPIDSIPQELNIEDIEGLMPMLHNGEWTTGPARD